MWGQQEKETRAVLAFKSLMSSGINDTEVQPISGTAIQWT